MKRFWSKMGAVGLSVSLLLGTMGMLSGCGKNNDPDTFTIWVGSSVNSSFYNDYGKNPVMQYLQKKFDIKLKFVTPQVGKEQDEFNKLVGSQDYPDMMDLSFYTDVLADLYDDGYGAAMDLTQYISDYMPNYSKFMADNAELTKYAKIDGKNLTLNNYTEATPTQWGGFMYRRDWLVKYDGNPDEADANSKYKDGVKFPDGYLDEDGYDNPLTIADWEYMFKVFEKSPDYEYAITLPHKGYHETGEIVSAFGMGGLWNIYEDETPGVYDSVQFGATTDSFRRYAETMNTWYSKGWLDKQFTSTANQMFYALDGGKVISGKVGMWYGTVGQVGNLIEQSSTQEIAALKGIDVWGARQPKETANSSDPTVFYQDSRETQRRWIITKAAKNKNLEKLFAMLDWLYSEEGAIVKYYGLSAEQWNEYDIDKSMISKYNLQDGGYSWCDSDGNAVEKGKEGAIIKQNPVVVNSTGDLLVSISGQYFFGLGYDDFGKALYQQGERKLHAYKEWAVYENKGTVKNSLMGQMSASEGNKYNNVQESIRTAIANKLPKLIKEGITNANWAAFKAELTGKKCEDNTTLLQGVIDRTL